MTQGEQIGYLKEIVGNYTKLINTLKEHINDSKTLKEMQWKNIIDYD